MKLKYRLKYALYSVGFFILFALLSIFVHYDYFRHFDYESMLSTQRFSDKAVDYIFSAFTLAGSSENVLIVVSVIFALFYLKKKRFLFSVFLYILIYPIELLGKLLIFHPKPPVFLNRYAFDFHLPSSFFVETSYSFPSGHMARSAFLITFLFLALIKSRLNFSTKRIFSLFLSAYLLLMFISRMYLGEHWFSDVLGGILLGASVGFLSFALW